MKEWLRCYAIFFVYFFFNDTATTEIYTLSLHDALPISINNRDQNFTPAKMQRRLGEIEAAIARYMAEMDGADAEPGGEARVEDRKSTRLNSSHANISYAVFCLKKKTNKII